MESNLKRGEGLEVDIPKRGKKGKEFFDGGKRCFLLVALHSSLAQPTLFFLFVSTHFDYYQSVYSRRKELGSAGLF